MARIGIDIGKVIVGAIADGVADTSFLGSSLAEALKTEPSEGAFEAIAEIVGLFEGVWLVSKCGPSVQEKTLAWLAHHRFYKRTGVPVRNVRFCRKRPEKANHARELALTHFIDDRIDVLGHLRGLVPNLYLFGEQERRPPDWVVAVERWSDVLDVLRADRLRSATAGSAR